MLVNGTTSSGLPCLAETECVRMAMDSTCSVWCKRKRDRRDLWINFQFDLITRHQLMGGGDQLG